MSEIITTLGTACFANNPKLKTVKISANITELEDTCFFRNEALTDIIFDAPENLQHIGPYCFGSNVSLKSPFSCKNIIRIGASGLGDPAFSHCINIPYIDFRGRTLDYLPEIDTVDEFEGMHNLKIIVDEDKYEEWMTRYGWCSWGGLICIDENGTKPVLSQPINREGCLTITALEDNVSIGFTPAATSSLQYNLTGKEDGWLDFPTGGITLGSTGDQISFKGDFPAAQQIGQFNLPNRCDISGPIGSSLVPASKDFEGFSGCGQRNSLYKNLFKGCTGIIDAHDLIIDDYYTDDSTYHSMFMGCTNLQTAPTFEIGTAWYRSLYYLFDGCNELNQISLLAGSIYFNGASAITPNTFPNRTSKSPGYLYINPQAAGSYGSHTNLAKYAQNMNWAPLTLYNNRIYYWNANTTGSGQTNDFAKIAYYDSNNQLTTKSISGYTYIDYSPDLYYGGVEGGAYACNIFIKDKNDSETNWSLVGQNVKWYGIFNTPDDPSVRGLLSRGGISFDPVQQNIQIIIMGTADPNV